MKINTKIDSNAVALSMKNFGNMPEETATLWINSLSSINSTNIPVPKKAIIEIANTCNLDCPMCRVGQFGVNLKRVLPLNDFKNIIYQLQDVTTIRLNGLGETTLVPDFEKYLQVLHSKGITVELISNSSGKPGLYRNILENNGAVLISWDAAEKEIFEIIRRPAKWEQYLSYLISISEIAKSINATDRLFIIFTLQKQNINQLAVLIDKCFEWNIRNIIVNVVKLGNTDWIVNRFEEIKGEFLIASQKALEKDIALLLPSEIEGRYIGFGKSIKTSACNCTMPWNEVLIRWNGDIQVCNMFNPYTYGNIFLNDFKTIWNNCFANIFRKYVNTKNSHSYCKGCVYINDAYEYRKK